VARRPSRKQARRDALFVLYQREVRAAQPEQLYAELRAREGYTVGPYTVALVDGVTTQTARLDAAIGRYSRQWPVERLAPLERSLLRLALHEITAGEVPPEVAVDEAVRLARRYSSDEAGVLVNGILGAYLRDCERGDTDTVDDARTPAGEAGGIIDPVRDVSAAPGSREARTGEDGRGPSDEGSRA